jgi:hypothetical protein
MTLSGTEHTTLRFVASRLNHLPVQISWNDKISFRTETVKEMWEDILWIDGIRVIIFTSL